MDTVIHFFDEYSYDFSVAPKLLTQPILEKIEQEAKDLNFLPRTKNKLPFHWLVVDLWYTLASGEFPQFYSSPKENFGES